MRKIIFAALSILMLAGCGNNQQTASSQEDNPYYGKQVNSTANLSGYTMADVQKHNTEKDCWTAIDNQIYDITSFVDKHPGGKEGIIKICGKDGSKSFNNQHAGEKKANEKLFTMKIGNLIEKK